jgi:hypothetical protein
MNYESALHSIQSDGFLWERIQDYFPFGDESLREGNYQRLTTAALGALKSAEERQLLLDLLDAQACVFAEQVWVANEMAEKVGETKPFPIGGHFSMAWLQIHDYLRFEYGLPPRQARTTMLKLQPPETLAQRIVAQTGGQ